MSPVGSFYKKKLPDKLSRLSARDRWPTS